MAAVSTSDAAPAQPRKKREKKKKGFWLNAWLDPLAGLDATSSCIRFADLNATGDFHLLVGTFKRKLKIYRGTALVSEHALLGIPSAICALHADTGANGTQTTALAVASGPYVFIYRNLRPYFKFTIPNVELDKREEKVWEDLAKAEAPDIGVAFEQLVAVRDDGGKLSTRSLELLALEDPGEQTMYVDRVKDTRLTQKTVITCMETIRKDSELENSVKRLVIGTEDGLILIVNPIDCSILTSIRIPGIPVFLAPLGLMDVDYRIVVACRAGKVYTIKNGTVSSKIIEVSSPPVGLVSANSKEIFVGTTGNMIHSFHIKGKKNFSIWTEHPILSMALFAKGELDRDRALMVCLANGEIRLYKKDKLLDTIVTKDKVVGMRCGHYGRESVSLVTVHKSGALAVRIHRRRASLDVAGAGSGPPKEQDIPLDVPKKTKLYVDQTQREREQATEMHRIFQRDLCKLRLTSARSYVKIITDGNGPVSYSNKASVRLTASVQGLGPLFKIVFKIQNTGRTALTNIPVTFGFKHDLYQMPSPFLKIPVLIPGLLYHCEAVVRSISETGAAGEIRIFVCSNTSQIPIITAIVEMPLSEVEEVM